MTNEEEESRLSALQENISKKGKNAYYYAHGNKIDGPVWDGKEEPRLIALSEPVKVTKVAAVSLDSFSWLDETKNIKVYVDFENAHEIEEDDITVVSTNSSVEFKVSKSGKHHVLVLRPLNEFIDGVTYKKKSDKFILVLKKSTETTWHQLKKTS